MPYISTIKHLEFWVTDLPRSLQFYQSIFSILGWDHMEENSFSKGATKIYFIEQPVKLQPTVGPRHLCFLADSRQAVDKVADFLLQSGGQIIRGPLEYEYAGKKSYTIDFRDPDNYVIEVATESVNL
jgi:catechol 2,3-dioxygenase-like lactoylglutathione lyase family enzyme